MENSPVQINISPGDDIFWCDKCALQIVGKRKFTMHNRSHETISCPKCNKDVSKKNKARHMKTSQGDQADIIHQCNQCDRQFATQRKSSDHQRSHQEVLYAKCGYVFTKSTVI